MFRVFGLTMALCFAAHASETSVAPPRTTLGVTLGGAHVFYNLEAGYKIQDRHALIALFTYQDFEGRDIFYGLQYNYFPFRGAFALSPGASVWHLHYGYSAFVPNLGLVYEKSISTNWMFKFRPFVAYQSRKDFVFPWIGVTLSRKI